MAGWKLRKDKTLTETADTGKAEAEAPPETAAEFPASDFPDHLVPPDVFPDFEAERDLSFDDVESANEEISFDAEDPALTLVDYSESPEEHDFETIALPRPAPEMPPETAPEIHHGAQAFELPAPAADADFGDDAAGFTQTLRMNRGELTAAFPPAHSPAALSGIPTVAPFVLDIPAPEAAPEPEPRLVMQIGRLSADFALRSDVTTIGRPDSALQYYPDVEIDMDDAVSRRHAEIIKREDGFYLADAGSTNGTQLNGELLPAHQERLLVRGDHIRVGERTEIVFG